MNDTSQCGYVAIIGRPNVGKSTLLNDMLGKKISITSDKPQTTRTQILGIKTSGPVQALYIDTPGLHKAEKNAMNRYMNRLASSVITDADVIVFMIEASRWLDEDEMVLDKLKQTKAPVILAINKVDKLDDKAHLLPLIEKLQGRFHFVQIIPISATRHENIDELEKEIFKLLPEGPHLFPEEDITDKSRRFQAAEFIREKIIRATGQEVPYSSTVEIESFTEEEKLIRINAIIWVEREGQKAIIIGKEGEKLKQIGTAARKDIEAFLGKKVFLRLWVKVKTSWTNDDRALKSLGFE
ncbi:MAG: GTPase Era [Gammaproteobacteria bacterium]